METNLDTQWEDYFGEDSDDEVLPTEQVHDEPKHKVVPEVKKTPGTRAGSPRTRVTEGNARYLAFAGLFPAADTEAFSILSNRQDSPLHKGGDLPTVKGTTGRLRKLHQLDALERFRQPTTGDLLYGLAPLGFSYAREFGYDMAGGSRLDGISLERLHHYRMIAHVAAQFVSPGGFFRESLGIEPVEFDHLITEKTMRAAFQPVKDRLGEEKKQGKSGDYGRYRNELLKQAATDIQSAKYSLTDLTTVFPTLLTLGQPQREGTKLKAVHQPDLTVLQPTQNGRAGNLMIEVELTKKNWGEYDSILATLQQELKHGYIYSRAVYFTTHPGVEALLKKVDAAGEYNLFSSGQLLVLPILDRDGNPVQANRRVTVGVK